MCQLPPVRPEYGEHFVRQHESRTGQRLDPVRRQAALDIGSHFFVAFSQPDQSERIIAMLPGQSETSPEAQEERRLARQSAGRRATILTGAQGAPAFNRIGGSNMLLGQTRRQP